MPTLSDRTEKTEAHSTGRLPILSGTVLVIDDEEIFRNAARRLLLGFGFDVIVAADGVEGANVFAERRGEIVFVLLDMAMPRMSGEQVFQKLRAIDPEVRVLINSGYSDLRSVRALLDGPGAQAFLQKPYDASALGNAIHDLLGE